MGARTQSRPQFEQSGGPVLIARRHSDVGDAQSGQCDDGRRRGCARPQDDRPA